MFGLRLGKMGSVGARTLLAQALAILLRLTRSPANIFTPGLGYLQTPANLLTWSKEIPNAAWSVTNGTKGAAGFTSTATGGYLWHGAVTVPSGTTFTAAFLVKCSPESIGKTGRVLIARDSYAQYSSSDLTLTGEWQIQVVNFTFSVATTSIIARAETPYPQVAGDTLLVGGAGLFSGTLSAEQIASMGGIPWTRETASVALSLGTERITNGNFADGATGWTLIGASVSDGVLNAGASTTGVAFAVSTCVAETNKTYRTSFSVVSLVGDSVSPTVAGIPINPRATTAGEWEGYSTIATGNGFLGFRDRGTGITSVSIDNISVRELISTPCPVYTDAHAYIAGANGAAVSGLLTNNYTLSDGSTGYSAVDGSAGLVLDGMCSQIVPVVADIGVPPSSFDNTLSGVSSTGFATTAGATSARVYVNLATECGKNYRIQGLMATAGAGTTALYSRSGTNGAGTTINSSVGIAAGTGFSLEFTATSSLSCFLFVSGSVAQSFSVSNMALFAGGIHATQPTTLSKPAVKLTGSKYYWQFDGLNDYLTLGSVPFQQADDHMVVVAVNPAVAATNKYAFSQRSNVASPPICGALGVDLAQNPVCAWRDDAGVSVILTSADAVSGPCVIANRKVGNTRELWVNGVLKVTNTTALGTTSITHAAIGAQPLSTVTDYFNGPIYSVLPLKGTFTDAELLTEMRLAGQIAGVTF